MSETQDQGRTKRDETAKPQAAARPNAPPPGPRMKAILLSFAAVIFALIVGVIWGQDIRHGVGNVWQIVFGEPQQETDTRWYSCGMHPSHFQQGPGLCPVCHMDLTPIDPEKLTSQLNIDPVVVQNIGVRIEPVVTGPVTRVIRTVGTVAYDETRMQDTIVRVDGQIETLYANYIGMPVKKGDVLADFHSPMVMAAEHELLIASESTATADGARIIEAAKDKLRIYGVPDADIEAVLETGKVPYTFRVLSPIDGFVHSMGGHEGHWLKEGEHMDEIADLSRVWVMVTLYEYQAPFVEVGQQAVMSLPYLPGRTFEGKITYVYPYLDEMTRQVNVRLEFDNPDGVLKPGMFTTVELMNTL